MRRAVGQLMAETIEKERGRGGGEAMITVAKLEEDLRQVSARPPFNALVLGV
jgi:hypothetical protein